MRYVFKCLRHPFVAQGTCSLRTRNWFCWRRLFDGLGDGLGDFLFFCQPCVDFELNKISFDTPNSY